MTSYTYIETCKRYILQSSVIREDCVSVRAIPVCIAVVFLYVFVQRYLLMANHVCVCSYTNRINILTFSWIEATCLESQRRKTSALFAIASYLPTMDHGVHINVLNEIFLQFLIFLYHRKRGGEGLDSSQGCNQHKLLSLISKLSFITKVVRLGLTFLRGFINMAKSVKYLHYKVKMNVHARRDIA